MSVVDICCPSYRGIHQETHGPLMGMMQATNCMCRDGQGRPAHMPWQCTKGRHSVRLVPPVYMSSVVHWARNQSIAMAMYGQHTFSHPNDPRPPADYLFLMDDDMTAESHYLARLLSYKVDIVCGICTVSVIRPGLTSGSGGRTFNGLRTRWSGNGTPRSSWRLTPRVPLSCWSSAPCSSAWARHT